MRDDESAASLSAVARVLTTRERTLDGALKLRRALPSPQLRSVGPFVFFDHFGPTDVPPGEGLDVRPHPHIGIATLTYLLEGVIVHRDSLGNEVAIKPGEVNWMTAGRFVVHSERSGPDARARGQSMHGTQLWVALSRESEGCEPSFRHYEAREIPAGETGDPRARVRVVVGRAFGVVSPVETDLETLYLDVALEAGAALDVPALCEERAVYVLEGSVFVGDDEEEAAAVEEGVAHGPGVLLLLRPGLTVTVHAVPSARRARFVVLGGAPLDGPRYLEWNFVASSRALIEAAKTRWKNGDYPRVVGDEVEFIPLPEEPRF